LYKKDYAISHGYMFLEIPYWTEKTEEYKTIIDNAFTSATQKVVGV
jgi:hypothetical protein